MFIVSFRDSVDCCLNTLSCQVLESMESEGSDVVGVIHYMIIGTYFTKSVGTMTDA